MRISYWSSDVCSSVLAKCIRELCNGARAEDWLGLKMIIVPDDPRSEVMSETLDGKVKKVFDGDGFLASVWNPLRGDWVERVTFRFAFIDAPDRKSTRLNSSHQCASSMPSSA